MSVFKADLQVGSSTDWFGKGKRLKPFSFALHCCAWARGEWLSHLSEWWDIYTGVSCVLAALTFYLPSWFVLKNMTPKCN